jgi:hypothetical protein
MGIVLSVPTLNSLNRSCLPVGNFDFGRVLEASYTVCALTHRQHMMSALSRGQILTIAAPAVSGFQIGQHRRLAHPVLDKRVSGKAIPHNVGRESFLAQRVSLSRAPR